MQTLSATDVKQGFDDALDAAQPEPVIKDRDVAVLISVQEFEKLRGLRLDVFDRLAEAVAAKAAVRGMTDETLNLVMTRMSANSPYVSPDNSVRIGRFLCPQCVPEQGAQRLQHK